ncbi:23S rRNA pseudouridine(955/2504/2580) synthase RluC [Herbaspirillum robiniae]|uniref:Pseudouridine synthase n=1 Tax=Herbaspirillum robiniae TaxID=2014887 RepID=A0A246WVI4_9BURK|nr:23S rRNA pseudouridine(955/2504/2580) synthase RluC [Herbaspirillum robiniae]NUU00350.1 23S rRNA pseudouridine(955/2504/2580) synthase RluC [Herbaspirillum robiniae]OWY31075.1 23S rRNA pseudouridine(955/2504/2580) synthase [Herbaspirillum robiniae]
MKDLARFSRGASESAKGAAPSGSATASQNVPQVQLLTISEEESGQRIDNFLLRICKGVPKSHIYRVLRSGEVRVNKGRIDQTYRLVEGDVVRVPPIRVAERQENIVPGAEFRILLEDSHMLVIDKPAGVAVHGGSGVSYGVIEQLRAARPQAKFLELVHRLDRDTSGVLLIAKKRSALTNLHDQMRDGVTDKRYLTLVQGDWKNARQHVKLPLFKYSTPDGERRVRVQADGQPSHTVFSLMRRFGEFALLEAELKTGRTHQIRVHLSSSGFPIVGDDKYGDFALNKAMQKADGRRIAFKRMFLHAWRITFTHPESGEKVTLKAALPQECENFLRSLQEAGDDETLPAGIGDDGEA